MSRSFKKKIILETPQFTYYKPAGVKMFNLKEIIILKEEFEAMRLKDLENKNQTDSAQLMGIHQSTFQRLLTKARKKLIQGIYSGYAIKIEGGNFIQKKEK